MAGRHRVDDEIELEFTPTWIVAFVCLLIVFISLAVERNIHYLGKHFKKTNQKTLFEALEKVKEELMLLGFMSLVLTVLQQPLRIICIPRHWNDHMLPCSKRVEESVLSEENTAHHVGSSERESEHSYLEETFLRRHCKKGKVPLLSSEAVHQLHMLIFVLALTHVMFTVLTMLLGEAKIMQWKHWEDAIREENRNVSKSVNYVHEFEFIQDRFKGTGTGSLTMQRLHCFVKQFYGSVTKTDYRTMRLGFIMTHCKGNPKFNFHKYMVRALEHDFKKVIGISWYLWSFTILCLFLNVNGWHTYFWMAFIPLGLLLAVGTKLEHVISQLARDVVEKHSAVHGDLVVKPSDEHFWFQSPRIMLYFIHFVLFENAFQIAYFFWILVTYGFQACIMDKIGFIIPRLIIGGIIQILCSYSTLPLYAIVTQMGSSFKKGMFEEHLQESLLGWAKDAKKRNQMNRSQSSSSGVSMDDRSSIDIQTRQLLAHSRKDFTLLEEGALAPSSPEKKTDSIKFYL